MSIGPARIARLFQRIRPTHPAAWPSEQPRSWDVAMDEAGSSGSAEFEDFDDDELWRAEDSAKPARLADGSRSEKVKLRSASFHPMESNSIQ